MGDFIDLSVSNAFDRAKYEFDLDFISLKISTEEIAAWMKENDWFLDHDVLEDIEAAIERYKIRNKI